MSNIRKATSPDDYEKNDRRYGRWLYLLFLLFVVALISSGIAGYLLGLKASPVAGGQLIDTILLDPEKEIETSTILHLTGHVRYSDGTPATYRTLELHSDPMRTETDFAGNFLFSHVPMGEHSISILNDDGSVAARREIDLNRKQDMEGISIGPQEDGKYLVELAVDIRMLEIAIELDDENYYINPDNITYETMDGTVVTPTGAASVQQGPVVTPHGNVCLPDGTIVLPKKGERTPTAVILPDDTVIYPEAPIAAGDIMIAQDGTVTTPDGTVVAPGGEIHRPDGQIRDPGEGGVIVTDEDVIPIGGANPGAAGTAIPQETEQETRAQAGQNLDPVPEEPAAETLPASTEGLTDTPSGEDLGEDETTAQSTVGESSTASGGGNGGNSGGNSGGGGGGNGDSGGTTTPETTVPETTVPETTAPETTEPETTAPETTEPETTETETVPGTSPEETDQGSLDVAGQVGDTAQYLSWKQVSTIDLFYNRDNPDSPIRPGAKGFYMFRLKNTRREALSVTLTITEGENHLPLKFKLTSMKSNGGNPASAKGGSLEGYHSILELNTAVDAASETDFRLDWEWPPDGNNREDTEAGKKGGDYMLTLTIHAEGQGQ